MYYRGERNGDVDTTGHEGIGKVEIQLHLFLPSALGGGEWSYLCHSCLIARERISGMLGGPYK